MLKFSFSDKLKNLPDYVFGIDRVTLINDLISSNEDYKIEARNFLHKILEEMHTVGASDLDFGGPGTKNFLWMRINGIKAPFKKNEYMMTKDTGTALICSVLLERQIDAIMMKQNTDFSYSVKAQNNTLRYRSTAYMEMNFIAINFRMINPKPYDISSYHFPVNIVKKMDLGFEKRGLVLVTGITGSGKSTTLDAIIDMNNRKNQSHIVIIGNPIEYFHKSQQSLVRHREVERDTMTFKEGATEALRQDPDIIVVGEMRDSDTILTVLETTDSGHKCFSTLHTSSAVESIHRIIGECPTHEQNRVRNRLSDVLSVVISQKLVPTTTGKLTLAKEILNVTSSVRAAILNDNVGEIYQMITEGKKYGMMTLEQDLASLYNRRLITKETAISYANNKKRMFELLGYRNR